eukprot:NODE_7612_length_1564_cov_4.178845.p1 GENE.NODE_7612_length_1564_cov_4.178845~~NODE_7612_length_1564_cov_4.178845.p1  ORF type:complete len:509 (-),score=167.37 NODE_7612_length_1564_cov_4.178845:36-1508(-)
MADSECTVAGAASKTYEAQLGSIVGEVASAVSAAPGYELLEACLPPPELVVSYKAIAERRACRKDANWHGLANLRISESWRSRRKELVWMDDKVLQVERVCEILGELAHMPLLAHARAGDDAALATLRQTLQRCVTEDTPVAVKPRHGANAQLVYLWKNPREAGEAAVFAGVDKILSRYDKTWVKECWQLSQVPRGVVVQPLYRTMIRAHKAEYITEMPLELRVVVVFGTVIGATVAGHPFDLWVSRGGVIRLWDPEDLRLSGTPGITKRARWLKPGAVEELRAAVMRDWPRMRAVSERIVRAAGLDELRVDWLLGDARWGARIGELTYMGSGCCVPLPAISKELAVAYTTRLLATSIALSVADACMDRAAKMATAATATDTVDGEGSAVRAAPDDVGLEALAAATRRVARCELATAVAVYCRTAIGAVPAFGTEGSHLTFSCVSDKSDGKKKKKKKKKKKTKTKTKTTKKKKKTHKKKKEKNKTKKKNK